jgi:hypothetical protein
MDTAFHFYIDHFAENDGKVAAFSDPTAHCLRAATRASQTRSQQFRLPQSPIERHLLRPEDFRRLRLLLRMTIRNLPIGNLSRLSLMLTVPILWSQIHLQQGMVAGVEIVFSSLRSSAVHLLGDCQRIF